MIIPMKKVTLFCLESDRDDALKRLREMGILHVAPVRVPEDADVDQERRRWEHIRRALDVLPHHPHCPPSGKSAEDVVEAVWEIVQRRRDIEDELEALRHEKQRIEPFGDFDPASVRTLAENGIRVRLFQADPRRPVRVPEGVVVRELCRTKQSVCLAAISRDGADIEDAHEVRLPEMSLGALNSRISEREAELREWDERLASYGGDYPVVAALRTRAEERYRMAEVRAGMGEEARISYLQGFAPARESERIRAAAAELGWGLRIADPDPDDPPPTLVENPSWIRPIRAIFEVTGLVPGYDEVDISFPFLVFLSVYFSMLVGDAGYGVLFIILTALARRRFRSAPAYPFRLLYIMSGTTVLWGALTGTWFGLPREGLPLVPWLDNEDHVKLLCFLLGATHLSVAHIWRAIRLAPSLQALAQLGWVGSTWVMFLAARVFLLEADFPGWGLVLLAVSVGLVLLFSVPPKALRSEGITLAMLPLDVIGNFTDVVSYLRLFAVGTASYAVAYSFNEMISPMMGSVVGAVFGAVLLFLGHALNIALCGLGILVHGVRLNTLEFSSHMGMQWTGRPYTPFRRKAAVTEQ